MRRMSRASRRSRAFDDVRAMLRSHLASGEPGADGHLSRTETRRREEPDVRRVLRGLLPDAVRRLLARAPVAATHRKPNGAKTAPSFRGMKKRPGLSTGAPIHGALFYS